MEKRWRCNVCESLNDNHRNDCIVCGMDKECGEGEKENYSKVIKCSFPGCTSKSKPNQIYCDYHYHTVCPICKKNMKESDQGFCVECGLTIVEKQTSKLRIVNTSFTVLTTVLSIMLSASILLFIFYFN